MNKMRRSDGGNSRRIFLKRAAAATVTIASSNLLSIATESIDRKVLPAEEIPWYRRVTRWGQTNITEKDPAHYDIKW